MISSPTGCPVAWGVKEGVAIRTKGDPVYLPVVAMVSVDVVRIELGCVH